MNEAFTLAPTPDGGMQLRLNLAQTSFVVSVSPAELDAIRKRVEAWHTDMHRRSGGTAVSGDPMPYVRRQVMSTLMQRMAEVTPPGLMGAAAKATLKKRAVAKKAAPKKIAKPAPRAVAPRPAPKPVARPAPKPPAAKKPAPRIAVRPGTPPVAKKPAPVAKKPAPVAKKPAVPTAHRPDAKKLKAIQDALKIVAGRAAVHLAQTKRKASKPNAAEVKQGKDVARAHFASLGMPTTNAPGPFWAQPLPTIQAKAQTAIKLAESKGAPAPQKPAPKVDPRKLRVVQAGLKLLAARRARMIAFEKRKVAKPNAEETKQGQAFANDFFGKNQIPSTSAPGPFWTATAKAIQQKVDEALKKAETLGAPKTLPKPFRLERTKLLAVQKGGKLIATRRAKFLAWQRKSKVTAADLKTGQVFAKDFLLKNGIPSTDAPHQFWTQQLPIIQTKVNSVVQLAEAQGAPAKPAAKPAGAPGVPIKPIVTQVPPSKTVIIKNGLQELAGRRARFLAWQRKATVTSPADIEAGKQWARQQFIKRSIPTTLPGTKTNIAGVGTACTIRGWIAPASIMGAAGSMTRARQLEPKITDAQVARSALGLARKQLTEGRAGVLKKFGGVMSRITGERQAALSLIDQILTQVVRTEQMLPASGPIDAKVKGRTALVIVQSGDALATLDKMEATSFGNVFSSGLKSMFGAIGAGLAAVVDAVSAFWSQPEPLIRQRVEDTLRELDKEAPASLPAGAPAVVPPPPGELSPDIERKRLIVANAFKAGVAKWKAQLTAQQMAAPEQVIINGVAAHFRSNQIPIDRPDPTDPFWGQTDATIKSKVDTALATLQAVAGRAVPPMPAPGELPEGAAVPGEFPEAADGAIPGEMPADEPYIPGEIPQPVSEIDEPIPGELPTAAEPSYPAGEMPTAWEGRPPTAPEDQYDGPIPGEDPYGDVVPPGEIAEPVTADSSPFEEDFGEIPGEIPGIDEPLPEEESLAQASEDFSDTTLPEEVAEEPGVLAEDYGQEFEPEGYMTAPSEEELSPEGYAPAESYEEMADAYQPEGLEEIAVNEEMAEPLEELPEFSTEFSTEMPTQEEVTGMFELGTAQKPRKISKQKYEQLVRQQAAKYAARLQARFRGKGALVHDAKKHAAQEAIWARAKSLVDAGLKKKGVLVSGAYLVGVSDIMGAAFVLGLARKGVPSAVRRLAHANHAARKGHPGAQRDVKALRLAARMKDGRRRRGIARPGGVPFSAQEAVYNWPAQRRNFSR